MTALDSMPDSAWEALCAFREQQLGKKDGRSRGTTDRFAVDIVQAEGCLGIWRCLSLRLKLPFDGGSAGRDRSPLTTAIRGSDSVEYSATGTAGTIHPSNYLCGSKAGSAAIKARLSGISFRMASG